MLTDTCDDCACYIAGWESYLTAQTLPLMFVGCKQKELGLVKGEGVYRYRLE
jgi:hypothetical protein